MFGFERSSDEEMDKIVNRIIRKYSCFSATRKSLLRHAIRSQYQFWNMLRSYEIESKIIEWFDNKK